MTDQSENTLPERSSFGDPPPPPPPEPDDRPFNVDDPEPPPPPMESVRSVRSHPLPAVINTNVPKLPRPGSAAWAHENVKQPVAAPITTSDSVRKSSVDHEANGPPVQ